MPLRHKCEKEIEEEMTWRKRFIVDKREHIARGRHTSRRVQSGHDPEAGRGTRCSNQEAQKRTGYPKWLGYIRKGSWGKGSPTPAGEL